MQSRQRANLAFSKKMQYIENALYLRLYERRTELLLINLYRLESHCDIIMLKSHILRQEIH